MQTYSQHQWLKTFVVAGLGVCTPLVLALEIDPAVAPQVDIGGRALITAEQRMNEDQDGATENETALNSADSALLFGFSKYLFDETRYGFANIGLTTLEDAAESDISGDFYLHQLHAGIGGERYEIKLGRTTLPNTLLAFPTLRDDDLLDFTHIGNAFSQAPDAAYQLYGGVVSGSAFWPAQRLSSTAAFTARTTTDAAGARRSASEFNGFHWRLAYDVPQTIKFDRGLRYAALAWDRQNLPRGLGDLNAVQAAAAINLNDNPEASWNLDVQLTRIGGIAVADLTGANQARSRQTALVAAVRYVHRPWLQTRWQAAVTLGWKDYADFAGASAWVVAPGYAYWLGSGITALAQYQMRHHSEELARLTGSESDQRIYAGLAVDFDYTLNRHVGSRNSILFLQHNIFETGPAGGGH